jgi:hypothetical protein
VNILHPRFALSFLIISLFFSGFIPQYAALIFLFVYFLINPKIFLRYNAFFFLPLLFILIAFISYLYNLFSGHADIYSFVFWLFSYFPPFLLAWLILAFNSHIDFYKTYSFYKKLVYIQSFFLIFTAIKYRTYVVGDPATGTIGDANWVAFHICVVLIYEITRLVSLIKNKLISPSQKISSLMEILYFTVILIIPESTANLGMMMIVLGLFFINEYFLSTINIKRIIVLLFFLIPGFYLISQTMVYDRIKGAINDLSETNIDDNPYLSKVSIYNKIISGELFKNASDIILGSGPSTFTSRSSVIRMPEERVNDFPFELPYFKSKLFDDHIASLYDAWKISGESWGNFASPQTTIISVTVELGILGILIFGSFFFLINRRINKTLFSSSHAHLKKFIAYFTLFFILSLFHLNFWEYPIISFTYIIFAFSIIGTLKYTVPLNDCTSLKLNDINDDNNN